MNLRNFMAILVAVLLLFAGCNNGLDSDDYSSSPGKWANHEKYLTMSDYYILVSSLSSTQNIDRSKIDSILQGLNVRQNYDYSEYVSGDYIKYSFTWSRYSSATYGWEYYVLVGIWVDSTGNLKEDMCSYYKD